MIGVLPGLKSRMAEFQFYVLVLSISKPSQVSAYPGQVWPVFFALAEP
jgi:hypothetical protein